MERIRAEIRIMSSQEGLWDADKAWATGAAFADGRGKIICGGGGCNIPRCTFQFWNANGVPCSPEAMEAVLSQIYRHGRALSFLSGVAQSSRTPVWTMAQGKVTPRATPEPMLGNPWYTSLTRMDRGRALPDIQSALEGVPQPLLDMNQAQRDALAVRASQKLNEFFPRGENWGNWAKSVLEGVAAARWASNLRWSQAVDGNWEKVCPFEWRALGNNDEGRTFYKFHHEGGEFPNYPPLMLAPKATALEQMGIDHRYSWRTDLRGRKAMYPRSRDGGGADVNPPLYGGTENLPLSRADFEPQTLFFRRDQGANRNPAAYLEPQGYAVAMPIEIGPQASFWKLWPEEWGNAFNGDFVTQLNAWIEAGRSVEGSKKFVNGEFNGLPHPYYVLSWVSAVLCDTANLDFLSATAAGMNGFVKYYSKLPESMQTVKPSQMQAYIQQMQEQSDQLIMGIVASGASTLTGIIVAIMIAAEVVPVIGTVVGAIIAAVVAIVGILVVWRYDLGLDRISNPPCPVPPFVRMIPATATSSVCDFDAERLPGASAAVNIKAAVIEQAAARGIRPGVWYTILKDMEDGGQAPQIPPTTPKSNTPIYIGIGVGLAAMAAFSIFRR